MHPSKKCFWICSDSRCHFVILELADQIHSQAPNLRCLCGKRMLRKDTEFEENFSFAPSFCETAFGSLSLAQMDDWNMLLRRLKYHP